MQKMKKSNPQSGSCVVKPSFHNQHNKMSYCALLLLMFSTFILNKVYGVLTAAIENPEEANLLGKLKLKQD